MNPAWLLWASAVALLLLALAGLLWPLLREPAGPTVPAADGQARLRGLYQAQRDELEREFERQTISPADRQQALDELQRRLLDDIDRSSAGPDRASIDGPWLRRAPAAALSVLLPLAALTLYLHVGDPRAAASLALAESGTHASEGVDVDAMVRRLAERLDKQPDDLEGWVVLARSREVQEDFDAAALAYRRAIELAARQQAPAGLRARLHADLADALASSRDGTLDGPVQAELDAALALDPDQPKALALAGTAALRRGHHDGARQHWQRLLAQLEPDSEIALRVQNDLADLETGGRAAVRPPRGIAGTVKLAPALRQHVQASDTVFIVVRARAAGPMPVAIFRLDAGRLPAEFALDDRHAMSPDRPLSRFDDLTVEARISRSGKAERQVGQPVSEPRPTRAGSRNIELSIDALDTASASN